MSGINGITGGQAAADWAAVGRRTRRLESALLAGRVRASMVILTGVSVPCYLASLLAAAPLTATGTGTRP